jgi:hypothetical protein
MGILCVVFVITLRPYNTYSLIVFLLSSYRVIQVTFGLSTPMNIKHVFGGWVQRMNEKDKKLLFEGMCAIF